MNTYQHIARQANQRREFLLREAEQERLTQMAQSGQRGAADWMLAAVGEWMIACGKRLKGRSESGKGYQLLKEINS